jgi:low temperature requirement protein LtrA
MRAGLATLWLRAAHHDTLRRATARRFALGESLSMLGWVGVALLGWPLWAFILMVTVEVVVPQWAERAERTTWHPSHIAERYGLFTLIVLGETILSSSIAFQTVIDAREVDVTVVVTAVGSLLTVFAMWWLYFETPAAGALHSSREGYRWGYGHFVVFASAAAVGAGVAVQLDHQTRHGHISDVTAAAAFTVPVILYVTSVVAIEASLFEPLRSRLVAAFVAVALIGATTFTSQPVLLTGISLAMLVAAHVVLGERAPDQAPRTPSETVDQR